MFKVVLFSFILAVGSEIIEEKINKYFNGESVRMFEDRWDTYKVALGNAVVSALKENYGHRGMNVYVHKNGDIHALSKGYHHSDGQVHLSLYNLDLSSLPYLWKPAIDLSLPRNYLSFRTSLSKMIVSAEYMVMRNKSAVVSENEDQASNSPFLFQQVQVEGQVAITIEDCLLSGTVITMLNGPSVNLGNSFLSLSGCHFGIEISTPGSGNPPVIADYNLRTKGLDIESLILHPIRDELMPKLQATMFTYVNTSAILGDELVKIRERQEKIFRDTHNFMDEVVRNINKLTVERNLGIIELENFFVNFDDGLSNKTKSMEISNLVLSGLETLYSSHAGGPCLLSEPAIEDELRFNTLHITGHIKCPEDKGRGSDFSFEISDLAVNVIINIDKSERRQGDNLISGPKTLVGGSKTLGRLEVIGWRSSTFSIRGTKTMHVESHVKGYISNVIPLNVLAHLTSVTDEAIAMSDGESSKVYDNIKIDFSQGNYDVKNKGPEMEAVIEDLDEDGSKSDVAGNIMEIKGWGSFWRPKRPRFPKPHPKPPKRPKPTKRHKFPKLPKKKSQSVASVSEESDTEQTYLNTQHGSKSEAAKDKLKGEGWRFPWLLKLTRPTKSEIGIKELSASEEKGDKSKIDSSGDSKKKLLLSWPYTTTLGGFGRPRKTTTGPYIVTRRPYWSKKTTSTPTECQKYYDKLKLCIKNV